MDTLINPEFLCTCGFSPKQNAKNTYEMFANVEHLVVEFNENNQITEINGYIYNYEDRTKVDMHLMLKSYEPWTLQEFNDYFNNAYKFEWIMENFWYRYKSNYKK